MGRMIGKCKYNPSINCETRDCRQCGWNASVSSARLAKIKANMPKKPARVIDIDKFGEWLKKEHPNSTATARLVEEYWRSNE